MLNRGFKTLLVAAILGFLALASVGAAPPDKPQRFIYPDDTGKLSYDSDERGNRVPDFSHCGYKGGGAPIPDVPVRVVVAPIKGDNGPRIQTAIDYVSRLPAGKDGIRGTVLLLAGRHEVAGSLRITTSGVVLRGQGEGKDGTTLVATGTDRRTFIRFAGKADRQIISKEPHLVADPYVPVKAKQLRLNSAEGLRVGDAILVEHPSTADWIKAVGMDRFPPADTGSWLNWQPGKMDLRWDRVITQIEKDSITLDSPITSALDSTLSKSKVYKYHWPGRIGQVGIENLRCESAYDPGNPHDEEHSWTAISMESVENAWVRQVTMSHFAGSAVAVWETCKCVTVEDCRSQQPISEIGGYRRHSFYTNGQMTLIHRCRAEQGRHDFAVGFLAAGPNAFVHCEAAEALSFSGPIESWASGALYDNVSVDGAGLELTNREIDGHGVGWAAANCLLWQCKAAVITCRKPPTAQNWAVGCWGQFRGDGRWRSLNEQVKPASLYEAQLLDRLGPQAVNVLKRRKIPSQAGEAKQVEEVAADLLKQAREKKPDLIKALLLRDGWLVCNEKLLIGGRTGTTWWRGHILPARAAEMGVGVTRFVPGRSGHGYTDDLDELTDTMLANGQAALLHHWGLWYDRRRDDHEMIRRSDGDVWPPFYEQPWARSGKGTAWDGLSKYDLTKFNPWYFGRLQQFAGLCDRKGLVLIHEAYFQHNILEAGAHWADFPWRPANCLQETGFPEPPPYVNNKRIFMAEAFYDVSHPLRRSLHRAYIRHCLDVLGDHSNVIYLIGEEYTGPLEFVQFWIDTVVEWQKETGKKILIGLSCTKDVQDVILADRERGPKIAVIDMKYWWYTADGGLYAPKGGQSLAPRQQLREWEGNKKQSEGQVARQIREYRNRYPDKAILCSLDKADGWAVLAAGGSIPNLRNCNDERLLKALTRMKPFEPKSGLAEGQYALAEAGQNYLVYSAAGGKIRLDLSTEQGKYKVRWIDAKANRVGEVADEVKGGGMVELMTPAGGAGVLWLSRE